MALTIALCLFLVAVPGASGASTTSRRFFLRVEAPGRTVDLVFVPSSTTVTQFAKAGFSPGLMSAGLGTVTPEQTYLDIGAGNRVFNSLYDHEIGPAPASGRRLPLWFMQAVERAESAPDEIEPGLMVRTAAEGAGAAVFGAGAAVCPLGITASGGGFCGSAHEAKRGLSGWPKPRSPQPRRSLARPVRTELVIAISTPTDKSDEPIPMGIAGQGLRRRPHLGHDPDQRLRALDRHRADDPRILRPRGPGSDDRAGDPHRGVGRPGGDRNARGADGGRLDPARPGDRLHAPRLGAGDAARRPR